MAICRALCLVALAALGAARPAVAHADPQTSVGLTAGGVDEDVTGPVSPRAAVHLGARGDVLFLRKGPRDLGFGPYVDVATSSFQNADLGGGLEGFLPLSGDLATTLSAGSFAREARGTWSPGVEGTLFFGARSYNYDSVYGLTLGLFAQTRWIPTSPASLDAVFGVQVDAEVFVLPFLLAWGAVFPH